MPNPNTLPPAGRDTNYGEKETFTASHIAYFWD